MLFVEILLNVVIGLVFLIPILVLWDLVAFIIFIVNRKKSPEKRRNAETGLIISSVALTLTITLAVVFFLISMLLDSI